MKDKQMDRTPSILFIIPTDYGLLVEKGVTHLILEREEEGFFENVFTIHPHALQTQRLVLNERHHLIELGPDYPFALPNYKFLRKAIWIVNRALRPPLVIKTLVDLVKREKIDLIRSTDPYWAGFYAWATSRLTGIPFCVSIHADYDKVYRLLGQKIPFSFSILERFVLPRADLVMPISEYLGRLLVKKGVSSKEQIRLLPHGVDPKPFLQLPNMDLVSQFTTSSKKVVSMVGRLSKEKYVYDAIEVARRLSKYRDDFILLFIGDGAEREGLELLIERNELSDYVRLVGFQPNQKVRVILSQSTLSLCLLSGFGLIETCMAGVPPICYDIEWHQELVKDGETGLLIKESNLDALTEAVTYLLDHPDEAKEIGTRAREQAMAKHELSHTSEIKKSCYRELLGSSAS